MIVTTENQVQYETKYVKFMTQASVPVIHFMDHSNKEHLIPIDEIHSIDE